jgi:predicted AAA+ superfamily ATPase
MPNLIPRKDYVDFLIGFRDKPIIKVVSGIRRCGKSEVLNLYMQYLLSTGVQQSQIVAINFEEIEFERLTDYTALHAYVKERLVPGKMTYVFLDEIQHVDMYEKAVDSLYVKPNTDIYITGSNAYFLSGELATLLTGRYVELKMLPFSFKEYCAALPGDNRPPIDRYNDYVTRSAFPFAVLYCDTEKKALAYLDGLYHTILSKDVTTRYSIGDPKMLHSVISFVFSHIGSRLSPNNIANTMTSGGRQITIHTVEKYLEAIENSLLVYQAKRYNVRGKQHLKLQEKYYVADLGLRYMLLGGKNTDIGHILENVVYLELIRRGYAVYVGQVDDAEVDFVAINNEGTLYIQVAASVRDPETLKRELTPLQKITDHYPKLILTLDEDFPTDYEGINRANALRWLLE